MRTHSPVVYLTAMLMLYADPIACQTTGLINSFTVNGVLEVKVPEGSAILFQASRLDNVPNPDWSMRALSSGQFIIGGPRIRIRSRSVNISVAATPALNGTVECQATVGDVVDFKTVVVIVTK
ncbi:hypothetical protein BgiBS90_007134 [Biomphalaria glabrata]|nr:hypothetical protein BgiBS90_007134 [Biomphalaria glabrata]